MEFTQYKCPVCNEQFKSGDDIVVCPECGTPHHRVCYLAKNKCAFEALHEKGYVWDGHLPDEQNPEQPAAEQPAEEQPAAEQPAEEQPAAEQPAEEQPAAEQPAEEQQQPAAAAEEGKEGEQ